MMFADNQIKTDMNRNTDVLVVNQYVPVNQYKRLIKTRSECFAYLF